MLVYMAKEVLWEKESFRANSLALLALIALKSWTCGSVTNVKSLLKIETLLNVISVRQKYI